VEHAEVTVVLQASDTQVIPVAPKSFYGVERTQFSDGLLKALIHPDPPTQGAVAWGARIVKPEGPVVFEDVLPFLNLWPLFHLLGSIRETLLKQAHKLQLLLLTQVRDDVVFSRMYALMVVFPVWQLISNWQCSRPAPRELWFVYQQVSVIIVVESGAER
jgi:hypothetical protein